MIFWSDYWEIHLDNPRLVRDRQAFLWDSFDNRPRFWAPLADLLESVLPEKVGYSDLREWRWSMEGMETATFGAGCYWCIEAVFQRLNGVISVASGYAGGHVANPTYHQICGGETGHAEVVQLRFDPAKISFEHLLEWFWRAHDPTTLNRQDADVGTQYRSAIFYHDEKQGETAERSKAAMDASGSFADPIVTEIKPLDVFYPAENYHQDYFNNNRNAPYCSYVIRPKLAKLDLKS